MGLGKFTSSPVTALSPLPCVLGYGLSVGCTGREPADAPQRFGYVAIFCDTVSGLRDVDLFMNVICFQGGVRSSSGHGVPSDPLQSENWEN